MEKYAVEMKVVKVTFNVLYTWFGVCDALSTGFTCSYIFVSKYISYLYCVYVHDNHVTTYYIRTPFTHSVTLSGYESTLVCTGQTIKITL